MKHERKRGRLVEDLPAVMSEADFQAYLAEKQALSKRAFFFKERMVRDWLKRNGVTVGSDRPNNAYPIELLFAKMVGDDAAGWSVTYKEVDAHDD